VVGTGRVSARSIEAFGRVRARSGAFGTFA